MGSSIIGGATGGVTGIALTALAGEALLCCGPVGWGILIAGAAVGAVAGGWAGEKGESFGVYLWDNYLKSVEKSITGWLGEIGRFETQKVKNGYY